MMLEELLKADGYQTITAKTGKEACDQAVEHQPDLILMDYKLPLMNGNEVLTYLEENNWHRPVLIMTGLSHKSIADGIQYSFVKEVISKPFDIHELRLLVSNTIQS